MHGHVHGVTMQGLQGFSQVGATKTAVGVAAAAARRRLLRAAEELGGEVDVEMAEMVGQWKKRERGGVYRVRDGVLEPVADGVGERGVSYWV
jgi:hypothetical protein